MARQRNPPQLFGKSSARALRVTRGRNARNTRQLISPSRHKKGAVLDKESLVRTKLHKQLANKPIATPLTDSDDSDGLVTRKRNAGKVQKPIYASGGVAQGDTPGAHPIRKRKSMDNELNEDEGPEKRRQTSQGSGWKRPAKSSLRSPLAPILLNTTLSSSPANPTSSAAVTAPLASSAVRPNMNTSILPPSETSILGTLKPRKRQPSILQIIESNDSSRLSADDENENEFLPDDESTPLPIPKTTATIATPGSSLGRPNKENLSSSGLRRPTPASKKRMPSGMPSAVDSLSLSSPPALPELPVSTTTKLQTPTLVEEDSILAAPISSSPDASPPKLWTTTKNPASSKFKKRPNPISTASLQFMMPSQSQSRRPRRQQRQKQIRNEFDIPEDSAGSDSRSPAQLDGHDEIDNSNGSPFKPKPPRRKAPSRTKRDKAGSTAPQQRGTSILSNISTNSKVSKPSSKNAQGANGSNNNGYAKNNSYKAGGGARHLDTISRARGRGVEKENESLGGGFDLADEEGDEELRRIREKFEEIDRWGLEFEDVEVQEGSSQVGYR